MSTKWSMDTSARHPCRNQRLANLVLLSLFATGWQWQWSRARLGNYAQNVRTQRAQSTIDYERIFSEECLSNLPIAMSQHVVAMNGGMPSEVDKAIHHLVFF